MVFLPFIEGFPQPPWFLGNMEDEMPLDIIAIKILLNFDLGNLKRCRRIKPLDASQPDYIPGIATSFHWSIRECFDDLLDV
ncbi:hypothetical protein AVEN_183541-1 [Araneus ventricosus]|uniref:Uncharacterized protein n=1 Tax=Araneus ventricosus TaxID=182803 RepID=A0A4Y2FIG6_ARAVE|nr:hypothetical protein AVEN_183541-1 [Araneus ventricosus]